MKLPKSIERQLIKLDVVVLVEDDAESYFEGELKYMYDVMCRDAEKILPGFEKIWLEKECGLYDAPCTFNLWASRKETDEEFNKRKDDILTQYKNKLEENKLRRKRKKAKDI